MKDVLVRGLPEKIHERLQSLAKAENLSLNQALLKLISAALEEMESKREAERDRAEAYSRLLALRAKLKAKYGKFEDSAKLIRQERDERSRRL